MTARAPDIRGAVRCVGHGLWKADPAVQDCTMIDWDDVRYFLAAARGGSVRAAAAHLGVNHSTVLRRIAQLEERLGARMFEKLPSGYRLTEAGEEVLELADQMEASSHQLETRVFGRDQSVRGLLRVTLAPTLATHLLMPDFANFARLHPEIEMEILPSDVRDCPIPATDGLKYAERPGSGRENTGRRLRCGRCAPGPAAPRRGCRAFS